MRNRVLAVGCLLLLAAAVSGSGMSGGNSFSIITVGASGTVITQVRVYAPSITPTQIIAAIGTAEQTFTVTGLTTADKVIVNPPGSQTALCSLKSARVSAADTLALSFSNLTIALCTPVSGVYSVVAIRS